MKKNSFYVLILLIFSVLPRLLIYFFSLYTRAKGHVDPYVSLYYDALRNHLGEYLWYSTNIPPLTHILNAINFIFAGPEVAYNGKFSLLIFTFSLDIFGIYLMYSAARRFGISQKVAFFIVLFYSYAIVPFELWRFGSHYDHHTIFFTIFFIYSVSRLNECMGAKGFGLVSLSGALLVAQSSVNSIVVPVISAGAVILLNFGHGYRELVKKAMLVLAGPVLVIILISAKNYYIADTFSTSTKSGPAMMMFVRSALGKDNDRILKFIKEAGAPEWYLDCFNNSVTPPYVAVNDPNYIGWRDLAKDFGICFPWGPRELALSGTGAWPFDFEAHRAKFRKQGEQEINKLIDMDIYDMRYRKYLLSGYAPELSPRWIGVFGKVSAQVWTYLFFRKPLTFLRNMVLTHNTYYFGKGPSFFRMTLYSNGPNSLSTLAKPVFCEKFFWLLTGAYSWIAKGTYLFVPVYFITIACLYLFRRDIYFRLHNETGMEIFPFLYLACTVFLLALIYSSMADLENDRYFVHSTPYLMLLTGYFAASSRGLFLWISALPKNSKGGV